VTPRPRHRATKLKIIRALLNQPPVIDEKPIAGGGFRWVSPNFGLDAANNAAPHN
jgi:hypothetical protein